MVRRLGHVTRHPFLDDGGEQRAAQREYEKTRLAHAAALQERNVNEWRFGWNPKQPEVEELLNKGGDLEDAGNIEAAVRLYQKALAQEPEHLELRQYIDVLCARLNAQARADKYAAKQEEYAQHLAGERDKASLRLLAAEQREPPLRRGRQLMGAALPLSPQEYAQQLREQAREARRLREAAAAHEAELERRELAAAQQRHAAEKYKEKVGGGNDKLAWGLELKGAMQAVREEKLRRYLMEREYDPTQAPSSPLLGVGELHAAREAADVRRRNLAWFREQERIQAAASRQWGEEASVVVARPSSAGRGVQSGMYRESGGGAAYRAATPGKQRPASAYAGGGPALLSVYRTTTVDQQQHHRHHHHHHQQQQQQQQQQEQQQRASRYPGIHPEGAVKSKPFSPYAREDHPTPPVNPADVRARQQAFYAKHAKPEVQPRLGQKRVTPHDHQRRYDGQGAIAQAVRLSSRQR